MEDNNSAKTNNIRLTIVVVTSIAIAATLICIILLLLFRAGNSRNSVNYTAHDITSHVISKMNYDNLSEISGDNIEKYYEIPNGVVSDSAMYISARTDNFTELACFKLKNTESEQKVLNCVYDYTKSKSSIEQSPATSTQSMVSSHYPYVFAVISSDCENAVKTFEKLIN